MEDVSVRAATFDKRWIVLPAVRMADGGWFLPVSELSPRCYICAAVPPKRHGSGDGTARHDTTVCGSAPARTQPRWYRE